MASIIPGPGTKPAVTPISGPVAQAGSFTVAAGTKVLGQDTGRLYQVAAAGSTLTNNGTLWAETSGAQLTLATGTGLALTNSGLIYLHGADQVTLLDLAGAVTNSGSIYLVSDSGSHLGLVSPAAIQLTNSGLLAVQSLGGDATAIDGALGATIVNAVGGRILAEGAVSATVVKLLQAGDASAVLPTVDNRGLMEAHATDPAGTSWGIVAGHAAGGADVTIRNSGIIRADVAILGLDTGATVLPNGPVEHVVNLAGGEINGLISLNSGNDAVDNAGTINGDVLLGAGADTFAGAGTVNGLVNLGWDNDSYSGSAGDDRAIGGRGDDTMAAGAGDDLLIGGFGNDSLRGDAGNDGLIGEWGNDTITTSGGDRVEGGDGNDRIVLGDLTFAYASGGTGTDTLVISAGTRNFDLGQMQEGGARIDGFEAIELQDNQNLAIRYADLQAMLGVPGIFTVTARATDKVFLDSGWTHGANITLGGALFEQWSQAGTTVYITEVAVVTAGTVPVYAGFSAVAGGVAAPVPGGDAGLDYTDPTTALTGYVLAANFSIDLAETFVTDGAVPVFTGTGFALFANDGQISSYNVAGDRALGVDFTGSVNVTNTGTFDVETFGPNAVVGVFDRAWGIRADAGTIDNGGTVYVQSDNGHATAVEAHGTIRNAGTIEAIAFLGTAIGVDGVHGASGAGVQTFFNTGTIYVEGGGADGSGIAAIGLNVMDGPVVNDGNIFAGLSVGADPAALAYGVVLGASGSGASLVNNGDIQGDIAIQVNSAGAQVFTITNNGTITGDVQLGANGDTFDGTHGSANGTVYGLGGNDHLVGGAGTDLLDGGTGDDTIDGGGGADTASYASASGPVTINLSLGGTQNTGSAGHDTLFGIEYIEGSQFNDVLRGNSGDNVLDGGLGNDQLAGGAGNDTYYVNGQADVLVEALGQGTDTAVSTTGFYLYANVENLTLVAGAGDVFGVGNDLANALTGNEGANLLLGGAGNDRLNGKGGDDVLFGQSGTDTFVFERGTGGDVIADFVRGQDKIELIGIYASFSQVSAHFVQVGGDGAIDLGGGDMIVLHGVTMATLSAGDFILI